MSTYNANKSIFQFNAISQILQWKKISIKQIYNWYICIFSINYSIFIYITRTLIEKYKGFRKGSLAPMINDNNNQVMTLMLIGGHLVNNVWANYHVGIKLLVR